MSDISMNGRMARVFGGLMLAFAAIVALLTWWQVVDAPDLRTKDYNNQTAYYEQRIARGIIRSADGVVLARNTARQTNNGDKVFSRRYPQGALTAHAVGYSTLEKSRTGIERTYNDALTGSTRELAGIIGRLQGHEFVRGDNLTLTIDAKAQRIANKALAGKAGAIVALDPRTGAVLTLASAPAYDPNAVDREFSSISKAGEAPLLNRATYGRYVPGSSFKLVTAAAALSDGVPLTQSFPGGCDVEVAFGRVSNASRECPGTHSFTDALTHSYNITFARLGEQLGQQKLFDQMRKFGFFSTPPIDDLPAGELRTSGLYDQVRRDKLLDEDEGVDAARLAIGQERLEVTPLQMAMVVAAIANGGVLMQPYLVQKVVTPEGRTITETRPTEIGPAIEPQVASDLTEMMTNVVRVGTGTAAAIAGVEIAGKTGTADSTGGNQVWFVAFAPADDPTVAVAVTVEKQASGVFGGSLAAPVARDVLESLL